MNDLESANAYATDRRLAALLIVLLIVSILPLTMVPQNVGGPLTMLISIVGVVVLGRRSGLGWRLVGLGRPASWTRVIRTAALYWVILYPILYFGVQPWLESVTGTTRDLSRFAYLEGNLPALLRILPVLWITAGFFEELWFRALLIGAIVRGVGDHAVGWTIGVVVSSVVFGAAHGYQDLAGVLFTGIGGLILGALFTRHRDELWVLVLLHAAVDSTSALRVFLGWM